MNLTNPSVLRALLEPHGFRFSKSMGQNFLIAQWVPERIAEACARNNARMGLHIVKPDPAELERQIAAGSRFIAYGIDSVFLWASAERPRQGE